MKLTASHAEPDMHDRYFTDSLRREIGSYDYDIVNPCQHTALM